MMNYKWGLLALTVLVANSSFAGQLERKKAWDIHNRLTGVPPLPAKLDAMEAMLINNDPQGAIDLAMEHKNFLNVVVKNWLKPFSYVSQSKREELNDFVATAVGLIRDDEPFDQILYENVLYYNPEIITDDGTTIRPTYRLRDNKHYIFMENGRLGNVGSNFNDGQGVQPTANRLRNRDWVAPLQRTTQSGAIVRDNAGDRLPAEHTAGAFTTRGFAQAYFDAGTNRRMTRYAFMNFMCNDFEQLMDTNLPDDRVARDVERDPSGDSRMYLTMCVGCHAGQDALRGAWAYYDFSAEGRITRNTTNILTNKMNRNSDVYPDGFVTRNDLWVNYWARGANARLGWDPNTPISGSGPKSLGRMLSKARAFNECMAQRSWELLCLRGMKPSEEDVKKELAQVFVNSNYNMKTLFGATLTRCVVNE
jgi:hypothetical protein